MYRSGSLQGQLDVGKSKTLLEEPADPSAKENETLSNNIGKFIEEEEDALLIFRKYTKLRSAIDKLMNVTILLNEKLRNEDTKNNLTFVKQTQGPEELIEKTASVQQENASLFPAYTYLCVVLGIFFVLFNIMRFMNKSGDVTRTIIVQNSEENGAHDIKLNEAKCLNSEYSISV